MEECWIPERAVRAHLKVAESNGAEMRFGVAMESWQASDQGFELCSFRRYADFGEQACPVARTLVSENARVSWRFAFACNATFRPGFRLVLMLMMHRVSQHSWSTGEACLRRFMVFRILAMGSKRPFTALGI